VGPLTNTKGGLIAQARNSIAKLLDQGFGGSFVDHVIAGYEFLLRFYRPKDKIYFFGFSRGAYTARFLAEMIDTIGLLSEGNGEMIRFAWDTYSEFQQLGGACAPAGKGVKTDFIKEIIARRYSETAAKEKDKAFLEKLKAFFASDNKSVDEARIFLEAFKTTFCRDGVRVFFLGLFDCVNSVAQFAGHKAGTSPFIPKAPATYIRHAVSLHERRSMFSPALFLIDDPDKKGTGEKTNPAETLKGDGEKTDTASKDGFRSPETAEALREVYFVGNHGDIGGGWGLERPGKKDKWQYTHVLSDIALGWMVDEVREIDRLDGVCQHCISPVDVN
jgi:uncharacterized protein (DUF2235 family)